MEEADVRREIYHSLQGYGYWPIHGRDAIICGRCGNKMLPAVAGRPDILILNPTGVTKVMEVKVVDVERALSFAFSQIEDDQRRWMNAWVDVLGAAYIAIGTVNEFPRRTWVIPWKVWVAYEAQELADGRTYMPVDLSLYKKIPEKGLVYSLEYLGGNFKMVRILGDKIEGDKFTGAHWDFPGGHPITKGRKKLWH